MKKFAFASRHQPTQGQIDMAADKGIELIVVGDFDAFSVTPEDIEEFGEFDGVIVVHPAMAMNLYEFYQIGVFQRDRETENPPKFTGLFLY